jgi:hypothetical protein
MSKNLFLKIKVTNLGSKQEYVHSNVPIDHVEMIRLNPNLRVEVIGRSRTGNRRKFNNEENTSS